jgi:prophage antirepressor-like protein
MNEITPFQFPATGQNVRTVNHLGEPWFVGRDIANALGYTNPPKAIRDHVPAAHRGVNESFPLSDLGLDPQTVLISEAGMYRLIMRSNTELADQFQEWVTAEVLPTIRKTGTYTTPTAPQHPEISTIRTFTNGEFHLTFEHRDNTLIAHAPPLARGLAYRDANALVAPIPATEKGHTLAPTTGGYHRCWYVTEAGLHNAMLRRNPAHVRDASARPAVARFQTWVYTSVLPALHGTQPPASLTAITTHPTGLEPITLTWSEAAATIRQRWGHDLGETTLRRLLRSGGVLKQSMGEPLRAYRDWFWFTGAAWEIHPHAVPFIVRKIDDTVAELREFRFLQTRLELDDAGRPLGTDA